MKHFAVIGAGTMGNGIAHVFAQCGYNVNLIDVSPKALEKGLATISKNLDRQVAKEKISATEKENALNNITTISNLKDGVLGVDLVIEAATENIDLKLKIFQELELLVGYSKAEPRINKCEENVKTQVDINAQVTLCLEVYNEDGSLLDDTSAPVYGTAQTKPIETLPCSTCLVNEVVINASMCECWYGATRPGSCVHTTC